MATTFRVLVGRSIKNQQGAHREYAYPTWAEAHARLTEVISEELADLTAGGEPGEPCHHCVGAATAALAALAALPEGASFEADIDGCDYFIVCPATA